MIDWWNSLSLTSQIFSAVAIPATVVMILQTLLLLLGFGLDGDTDIDAGDHDFHLDFHSGHGGDIHGGHDGDLNDGFSLISIRGIVAFFSVGGWVGVVADSAGMHIFISCLMSVGAGMISLVAIAVLFHSAMKLQDSGNLDVKNAVGKNGRVYIPIPPKGMGHGKITVLMQERFVELEAINDGSETIKTDETVSILSVVDDQTVIVKSTFSIENKTKIRGGISQWDQE